MTAQPRKTAPYPGVSVKAIAANRKLARVELGKQYGRHRALLPQRPYCAATYVDIQVSCDDACTFKAGGCYAIGGVTGKLVASLDVEARGMTPLALARAEAAAIDAIHPEGIPQDGGRDGFQGRDLRLHVAGDARTRAAVRVLAAAAERWMARGGGRVWTYTHSWRRIPRSEWGVIQVLASCEHPRETALARRQGYAVALVVRSFNGRRAYAVDGMEERLVPCPAETAGTTCVACRLCLDADGLHARGRAIGFAVHGRDAGKAKRRLPLLDTLFGTID
ncbi:MAG: hypothetical protein AB7W59_00235 [Acidimicrobiia bacterium]